VVLGVIGTAMVAGPELAGASATGTVLALVAAVLYAVVVLVDRTLAQRIDAAALTTSKLTVAGILLLPIAVFADADWASASLGWLVVLGLVHTAFGLAVALDVLGRLPATVVAVLLYLEPASAVLFGWWLLGEQPTAATVVGGAVIIAAGLVVGWRPDRDTMPA
jgi:drug/metabolite transporter (DMT)-like permease